MTAFTASFQVWREDRSTKLRHLIRQLYAAVAALEEEFSMVISQRKALALPQ
jgi:hypothetical protein